MKATLLGWAYRLGYRRCLIAARPLTPQPDVAWPDGLRVGPFGPADAEPLRAVGADGLDAFAARLKGGDRPWGVWDGDTLIAYGWSSRRETDFSGLWTLRPGPGEAYLHNFFTHPAWRGRGLYPLLLASINKALADEGLTQAWIAVVSYNQASWRGVQKAGFTLAATYQTLGRWGGRLSVLSDQPAPDVARATHPSHGTPVPKGPLKGARGSGTLAGSFTSPNLRGAIPMSPLKHLFESEQPVAVVYPSYSLNSYGVIRALGEQGIRVLALDDIDNPNMRSRYVESMICPSATRETEKFIDFLADIGAKFRTPPVLYMMEDVYYYLAHEYREVLEPRFRFPYMAHAAMLDCIDKQRSFERLAMADPGIPLPGTWYPTTHAELNAIKPHVTFPVVLKPLVSRFDFREGGIDKVMEFPQLFNNKAVQAESWEELTAHFDLVERHGIPCCVQELIPGGQDALVGATLYVDAQGQVHGNFTYSKLRQTPWDFGTMTLGRAIEAPEVAALSERVVKALNFTGICGIEFKYDARDGRYKFIEINPRGELWMNLAQHCGVNLPLLKYQDMIGKPQRATQTRFDKHLIDLRDDFSLYFMRYRHDRGQAHRLSLREWLASVLQPGKMEEVVFNWRDPKPGMLRFKEYAARVLAHRLPVSAKTPPSAPVEFPEQQRPAA